MASQIYSRYVPGKKKTIPSQNAALDIPTSAPIPPSEIPLATRHEASSTYARYVPPPKFKKPSAISSVVPILSAELSPGSKRKHDDLDESTQAEPSSKKSKKNKISQNEPFASETMIDDAHQRSPSFEAGDIPKRKKEKKTKRFEQELAYPEGVDAVEQTEAEENKHKNVLEKREKSLRKAEKLAEKAARKAAKHAKDEVEEDVIPDQPVEIHDLGPLPQPEPVPDLPQLPTSALLPPWLASPIRVSPAATASFTDIGVLEDAAKSLQAKGFKEAFAVQAAVLPLLLPHQARQSGDVLVSAATGSGKTLAYVLPMVQNISGNRVTRLRGLIVMPTRELVTQAIEVCETCAHAFSIGGRKRLKIGAAVGNQTLKAEQAVLMEQELRYNPITYQAQRQRLNAKWESSDQESDGEDGVLYEDEVSTLPDHIIEPVSKVDILICTPGRLVEHLKSTPGFSLEYVRWLVVDEADKLLDQSFQQWLNTVMANLALGRASRRDRIRKIILSATLTRDIGQLNGLKLYRPQLVVLEGDSFDEKAKLNNTESSEANILPALLVESAIKVENDGDKPLYLMNLLRSQDMVPYSRTSASAPADDSSSSSEDEDTEDESSKDERSSVTSSGQSSAVDSDASNSDRPRGVLIFTKSNETAVRLGRLIALLDSSYGDRTGTLTSTTRNSARKAALRSFQTGKLSILVASDLVSRGLDLPNLAHVVNYDVPSSLTSYVHRVGRTARAGKRGHAWTLLTNTEARWFWNEVARSELIKRPGDVTRVNVSAASFDEAQKASYEDALGTLGREASSVRAKKSGRT